MNDRLYERAHDIQRRRLESDLAERVRELFRCWPALRGFQVRAGELVMSEIACYPQPGSEEAAELCSDISEMLSELVDERPEAAELLRSRCFARTLH